MLSHTHRPFHGESESVLACCRPSPVGNPSLRQLDTEPIEPITCNDFDEQKVIPLEEEAKEHFRIGELNPGLVGTDHLAMIESDKS